MKIIIKVLQGQQCTLEVPGTTTVLSVKQMISGTLKIPVNHQKLLLTGRPLSDEKRLCDYPNICDGVRLNLIICKNASGVGTPGSNSNSTDNNVISSSPTVLMDATYNFLHKYYSDSDSRKIADEFMKEFNRSVASLSLDDIERIAALYLDDESTMIS
ncbi:ubiquitin-like protein 4A isoform X2 [Lycorma delicatula]|uniref:ubiquitin-like protein 4A isoform X2 n=1 Tax=Lycorma delicatula TaxID=130591 RepID=UPI003F51A87D